jgi:hypothetical protein
MFGSAVECSYPVEQHDVVAHGDEDLPEHCELARDDVCGDRAVAVLLSAKVDEVGAHGKTLAILQGNMIRKTQANSRFVFHFYH